MLDVIKRILVAGCTIGAIAGNFDDIQTFFDTSVSTSQSLATAADLRIISTMLDYEFMKKGRYPESLDFAAWLGTAFKENPAKTPGVDHWGTPLLYRARSGRKAYLLVSAGPDTIFETGDDLKYTGP